MRNKNEFNYFKEFLSNVNLAKEAIKELKNYILNFDRELSEVNMKKIHEIENCADDKLHEIKSFLLKDFLPPIDREDIIAIAHKIDDLIDSIDEIAINIYIFNIEVISENMKTSINLLEDTINKTYNLISSLSNLKNIKEIKDGILEVNSSEERADRLYEYSIKQLYKNENDMLQIIKWTKMYECIENTFDSCENIADCIEEVVLKNS